MKKRLFSIIGPTQLLNVLTLIEESKDVGNSEDYLIIHDTGVSDVNHPIYKSIEVMATIHNWEKIVYLNPNNFYGSKSIFEELDFIIFDEVYLARNFRHIDECIIENYKKNASIIIYGDTLGFFDSLTERETINEVRLIIPVIPSSAYKQLKKKNIPIKYIEKKHLFFVLERLKRVFENVIKISNFKSIDTLFLTSYYSKVNYCTLEEEIAIYEEAYKKFIAEENKNIMLKAHPRDDKEICKSLKKELSYKYDEKNHIYHDFLNAIPMEILIYLLDIKKIVTIRSSAVLSAYLIDPNIEVCYLDINFEIEKKGSLQIQQKNFFKYVFEHRQEIINSIPIIVPLDKEIKTFEWYLIELFYSKEEEIKSKIKLIKQLLPKRKIIAYGAGEFFKYIFRYLEEYDITLDYIVNNNVKEKNTFLYNIPIINKEDLKDITPKPYILVTSSYEHEIKLDLLKLDFNKYADWIGFFNN